MGVAAVAITVLALATPGAGWRRRFVWTVASIIPLAPLLGFYRHLMQGAGATRAHWLDLGDPFSLRQWLAYVRGANILTLADTEPNLLLGDVISRWAHLPPVTAWAIAGLILFLAAAFLSRKDKAAFPGKLMRGWILVSGALILCTLAATDDIGGAHVGFLPQRILLLGAATLVPALRLEPKRLTAKMGLAALSIASLIQLTIVWNYSETANRQAQEFMQAKAYAGAGQRIVVLIVNTDDEYVSSPLLNLSNLLGVDTGNIIWNNYGPALYYFPVQFRDESNRTLFYTRGIPAFTDQDIAAEELEDWADLLSNIESKTDVLVIWGGTPELDEINAEWFGDDPVFENDDVRVFKHRENREPEASSQ